MREEARRSGEELPKDMQKPVQLFLGLSIYLNAWHELDGERDRNKLEAIRRSSVFSYADDYGFDELQRDDLWFYIREMDRDFLKFWKGKLPKEPTQKPSARERYREARNG